MFVRVPNHLADAGQGSDFFWRALRVTSGDYDLGFWVLAMDAANCGASVLIGGGRYGAGVKDNESSFGGFSSASQTALPQLAFDGSAVGLGSATSKIRLVESCHVSILT
jgi:hypothetical protein